MYRPTDVILLNGWETHPKTHMICLKHDSNPFPVTAMTNKAQDVALYISNHFQYVWDTLGFFDLQRLLYLAQGWHLATGKGPLFSETIGAHRTAPLVVSVKGVVPLQEMLPHPELDPGAESFLDSFCTTYGIADARAVRDQVERSDGAWRLTQSIAGEGATITHDLMRASFRLMLLDHADTSRRMRETQIDAQLKRAGAGNVVAFRRG